MRQTGMAGGLVEWFTQTAGMMEVHMDEFDFDTWIVWYEYAYEV